MSLVEMYVKLKSTYYSKLTILCEVGVEILISLS